MVFMKMPTKKKQMLFSIGGVLLLAAFIAFAILCPWSGFVWLVVWMITVLFYAATHGKIEQLLIINNKLISELQRVTNAASIAQTHNEMLISIIEKMEEGKNATESTVDIVRETIINKENEKDGE